MFPFIGVLLLLAALGLAAVSYLDGSRGRKAALAATAALAVVAGALAWSAFGAGSAVHVEDYSYYLSSLSVGLQFSLSGASVALVLMSTIIAFVAVLSGNPEKEHVKEADVLILLFELAAIGLFSAANLFLFFIFWDIGVVAMFFMLLVLGSFNRRMAAIKFIMYELMASMALLLAILIIYFYTPIHSFDIQYIAAHAASLPPNVQLGIFALLALAFLTNMPAFPLHLWLPDAHTEASTQGSMLLSGVLTKFGGYGLLITFGMLPGVGAYFKDFAALAIVSAVYAAFVMLRQTDMKRAVAYTTIVDMAIVLLGISANNAMGYAGAVYAMLAHGFAIALLFLAAGSIGAMFADRDIRTVRGVVAASMPTAYAFVFGIFAVTGLPLTATFIGEILVFLGSFGAFSSYVFAALASVLLAGGYLYFMTNRSVLSSRETAPVVRILTAEQSIGYGILIASILIFGIFPQFIIGLI